tara:strand:- start:112 stop:528 length:417 start_codon:yes stop_codon:yes gene_type:complete
VRKILLLFPILFLIYWGCGQNSKKSIKQKKPLTIDEKIEKKKDDIYFDYTVLQGNRFYDDSAKIVNKLMFRKIRDINEKHLKLYGTFDPWTLSWIEIHNDPLNMEFDSLWGDFNKQLLNQLEANEKSLDSLLKLKDDR